MKAMYKIPSTETLQVEAYALLQSVSGLGLNEGGEDNGTNAAQAPGRKPF